MTEKQVGRKHKGLDSSGIWRICQIVEERVGWRRVAEPSKHKHKDIEKNNKKHTHLNSDVNQGS